MASTKVTETFTATRFSGIKPGEFEEVPTAVFVLNEMPDGFSVRTFATPSDSEPNSGYYIQAVKQTKDPWDRAYLLCTCKSAMLRLALAVTGDKNTCKHSKRLREALKGGR